MSINGSMEINEKLNPNIISFDYVITYTDIGILQFKSIYKVFKKGIIIYLKNVKNICNNYIIYSDEKRFFFFNINYISICC